MRIFFLKNKIRKKINLLLLSHDWKKENKLSIREKSQNERERKNWRRENKSRERENREQTVISDGGSTKLNDNEEGAWFVIQTVVVCAWDSDATDPEGFSSNFGSGSSANPWKCTRNDRIFSVHRLMLIIWWWGFSFNLGSGASANSCHTNVPFMSGWSSQLIAGTDRVLGGGQCWFHHVSRVVPDSLGGAA